MPLDAAELGKVIEQLLVEYQVDRERLEMIDGWARGKRSDLYIPQGATAEYKQLVEQSKFNVLPLVVNALAQNLFVDGYRPTGESGRAPSSENSPIWDRVWQPNRMDGRQGAIYRSAIKFGYSYATVTPKKGDVPVVVTPYSPLTLVALYEDRVNDEWPRHAMVIRRPPGKRDGMRRIGSEGADVGTKFTVFDDEFIYEVERGVQGWEAQGAAVRHGWGVCPVIRFLDEADADDLPEGKVWPLLPAQKQLNQTTFNLAMAGQFGAFMQRWVTGMVDETPQFRARIDAMLRSDSPDTRFGQFDATPLDGYLSARDKVLLYVSSVAQIPPHNLLVGAGISNISAEALAALEAGHRHDIQEHQTSFGESIEQMLRLAGRALGDPAGDQAWEDTSAQVVWRDTTPRSLAQVADALGKMAQQLGIPVQALWEWLPGVTDQDIARWIDMANEDELMSELKTLVDQEGQRLQQEEPGAVPEGEPADARTPA